MKKGVFITNPSMKPVAHTYSWQKAGALYAVRDIDVPREEGLLTFCRRFSLAKAAKRATLRATALGIFDVYINGERIGDEELKPGWTDYRVRVFEFEYDITEHMRTDNVLTATVANGWWCGRISGSFYKYRTPAFCCEIEIEYDDGTFGMIASDESFLSCVQGPVMYADIWDGEYYDATEKFDVNNPKFESSVRIEGFGGSITPHIGEPVRVKKELCRTPVSAIAFRRIVSNGTYYGEIDAHWEKRCAGCERVRLASCESLILDMGQNMVGRPCISLRAKRGTKIRLYFSEMLNDSGDSLRGNDGAKGTLYLKNYRSALSRAIYVASGEGTEEYAPRFTFFGFRYMEIKTDGECEIVSITGEVLGTDMTETGKIETDNEEVNKLISNITWGARGNYISVPTDCPQRDERLGWTGDTQIFCGAGAYLMNTDGFMRKWLQDARDSQFEHDGRYGIVIPRIWHGKGERGSAAWTDAPVIVPYHLYTMYGDKNAVAEHYGSTESYMVGILKNGLEGPDKQFGDWLSCEETDRSLISYCYHAYDASLMAFYSHLLGKTEREAYYSDLRARIVNEFTEKFVRGNDLTVRSQTAYVCALAFDMVEADLRKGLSEKLENKIRSNGYRLSTGFVGTGLLCKTLAECGLNGLAYSLLLQTKDPSWLYSVRQGATTVWERWNSYTIESGFGDVKMNSFNHYAYGAVIEWMFAYMAGIRPDAENPGFCHIVLAPLPDMRKGSEIPEGQEPIKCVSASYECAFGTIRSCWRNVDGAFEYEFEIPEGASASVEIVAAEKEYFVEINGKKKSIFALGAEKTGEKYVFELTSGYYLIK